MNLNRINVGMPYVAGKATYEEYQESTMANTEQADRIRRLIAETVGEDSVTDDQRFDKIGLDSLDLVELTMAAEEQFGVFIDLDEAQALVTVGDAVKLIEEAIGKGRK